MKNFILTSFILLISVAAFAQAGTDKILYENATGTAAGIYTLDGIKTFIGGVTAPAAGVVKSNGTALQTAIVRTDYAEPTTALATGLLKNTTTTGAHTIAVLGTDYSGGTSALTTGIVKTTTGTGALTVAIAADFPVLNQSTTGTAANITGIAAIANGGTGSATQNFVDLSTAQASIAGAKTFTGGLNSSGATSVSGAATLSGATTTISSANTTLSGATTNITGTTRVSKLSYVQGAAITATTTLAVTDFFRVINTATAITVTLPAGFAIGDIIELPIDQASVGAITLASSASETFNGSATYTVNANSGGTLLAIWKLSATNFRAALRL